VGYGFYLCRFLVEPGFQMMNGFDAVSGVCWLARITGSDLF